MAGGLENTTKLEIIVNLSTASLITKIKQEVRELTKRENTVIPIEDIIKRLNKILLGWTGYFRYKNCSASLVTHKYFVEIRMALHLAKRHKNRLYRSSVKKYPSKRLYEEYGLYKIPTSAPWKTVHASE